MVLEAFALQHYFLILPPNMSFLQWNVSLILWLRHNSEHVQAFHASASNCQAYKEEKE